ncbi:SPOR domain-containing protein [Methylomonas sp. EFPC3]|uniref:SPOR domain-containing protein n=1 Tax=Methylomonas sp. EFPC3 TaxID=3021710 RepID=UPI002416B614|nr:SPOR domain-containing protein [Methylomonas sp. EFPC3]WFP48428.1 SPOR domain-containing protein [Methylomonas sp. EFPC3]
MAEPTGNKSKKTLDAFADDLDAMLNISEPAGREVGEIDDDEAIDRLLVGDETLGREADEQIDEFGDFDNLLEIDLPAGKNRPLDDIDEFGDEFDTEIAEIAINPGRESDDLADEVADAVGADIQRELEEADAIADAAELTAADDIDDIDEFADIDSVPAASAAEPGRAGQESVADIDEFGDEPESAGNTADFLMADFDITADDDLAEPAAETAEAEPSEAFTETDAVEALAPAAVGEANQPEPNIPVEPAAAAEADDGDILIAGDDEPELAAVAAAASVAAAAVTPPPPPPPAVDYSGDITALNRQVGELKRQLQQLKHELAEKPDRTQLGECQTGLENLQVEQKKTKRGLDALTAKKPVLAYAAAGVAGVALLASIGLGVQGLITKSQVGELVTIIGKLQEQANAAPTNDAAEMAMMQKQLDELTVSAGVMSTQITELSKVPHANAGAAPAPAGDQATKLTELANQNLQIGAAIETLQNKVSALEKGRTVVAAAPKPEKKKPEPVEENWAVNLVAFKQDWYAKSKAQEFAGKGVPAKVSKTETKGENWYRLSVDGFKTQYEAAAYAAKVKKTLNLDSVWVTRVKD